CITTFNKGVGKVAKVQGKAVGKCVNDFAAGRLVATTPETCFVTNLFGRLNTTTQSAVTSINLRCGSGPFPFGMAPITDALPAAIITGIDLLHGSMGPNLDTALIPSATIARCQAALSNT